MQFDEKPIASCELAIIIICLCISLMCCYTKTFLKFVLCPFQNTTSIFNLYGVTEVSSWATCYCVCESGPVALTDCGFNQIQVPLGEPLLGTKVEIRDENGCTINEGVGMIWAGNCLVIIFV